VITSTLTVLIIAHMVMGGLDTFYHHEFKERLAWRVSQRKELKLHGIRNIFYALIYLSFAVFNPTGIWAWILIAILITEIIITLIDFVEEDHSRKLPTSERILHTILALNFGAILVLLIPRLWVNGQLSSALNFAWAGLWSLLCTFAVVGALLLAVRDLHASRRLSRIAAKEAAVLIAKTTSPRHYLLTGGTGFIGSKLVEALQAAGNTVTVLTRALDNGKHLQGPVRLITTLDDLPDDGDIDVVVNLAGASTANYWSKKHKQTMLDSRLDTTRALVDWMKAAAHKPELFISGSAIGVYGTSTAENTSEADAIDDDSSYSQNLCQRWEAEALHAANPQTRVVLLRTGMVIDLEGGPLAAMLIPTEFGGGAILGNGKHTMSWITRDDMVRLIDHIVNSPSVSGPVNAVAPTPVSNATFTRTLARALGRPTLVKIPKFFLELVAGGFATEILLGNQHIAPEKLLQSGFEFNDKDLRSALNRMLAIDNKR